MRITVLGSSGLLGSSLVPHIKLCGHDVTGVARNGECDVRFDLSDAVQLNECLDELKPEVIVNLSALTDVDECERSPQLAYLVNVKIVENVAMWIQKNASNCYLVQISTDQVYDGMGPHKEGIVTLSNYYAYSKYAAELVAASVPSTVLRTNFFGPSKCQTRKSLSDWLMQSLMRKDPITVFEDVRFSPLSVQRLVELLEHVVIARQPGIFNLGSKYGMSKAHFAFMLAEVLDLPTKSMFRGTSASIKLLAYRPKDMCMDVSHFEEVFEVVLPTLTEEIYSMKKAYAHETR